MRTSNSRLIGNNIIRGARAVYLEIIIVSIDCDSNFISVCCRVPILDSYFRFDIIKNF